MRYGCDPALPPSRLFVPCADGYVLEQSECRWGKGNELVEM